MLCGRSVGVPEKSRTININILNFEIPEQFPKKYASVVCFFQCKLTYVYSTLEINFLDGNLANWIAVPTVNFFWSVTFS